MDPTLGSTGRLLTAMPQPAGADLEVLRRPLWERNGQPAALPTRADAWIERER
jgi:hypothetical protein